MPSPFPGMDPYLEDPFIWPDFHFGMNAALREYLNQNLPENYVAVAGRYIWIHEPEATERLRTARADVHIAERTETPRTSAQVVAPAPLVTMLPAVSREGNRFIRILDKHSRRVVTVLELLSPANKMPGPDREAYLLKRNNFLASQTNVVEIDFLRQGQRMPLGEPPPSIPDYYVLVLRACDFPHAGIWPISVRTPLPDIPIPLKEGEAPVPLSLKECFDHAYQGGRYHLEVDYERPLDPPLAEVDRAWAKEVVAKRGSLA